MFIIKNGSASYVDDSAKIYGNGLTKINTLDEVRDLVSDEEFERLSKEATAEPTAEELVKAKQKRKSTLFGALMLRLVQSIEVAGAGTSYPNMTSAAKTIAEDNPDASVDTAYALVLTELKID